MSVIAPRAPAQPCAGVPGVRARVAWACLAGLSVQPLARAADVSIVPVFPARLIGAQSLVGGAGGDFESPVVADVSLALLSVSNTAGGSWQLQIAIEDGDALQLDGVSLAIKRAGGGGEAGLSGGGSYRVVTASPQSFFSGSGDYASIEILLQIAGVSISRPPASYTPRLRYTLVTP